MFAIQHFATKFHYAFHVKDNAGVRRTLGVTMRKDEATEAEINGIVKALKALHEAGVRYEQLIDVRDAMTKAVRAN